SAMAINERARHEPQLSGDYVSRRHPAGCGCCSSVKRSATVTDAKGNKAFPNKRPWMISH
ncbi:MAG TPA: zinc ribbon domain-containing protein, partial [Burkholderiales bacterium]|nr:zinc ribbon domain-containing protein [Burkholderiales bacterium]